MAMDENALLLSLAIGTIGLGCFVYGKKQGRFPQLLVGATLMIYPYFVPNLLVMAAIAGALLCLLWVAIRFGL